jgi:GT2 family glycosyltransferase
MTKERISAVICTRNRSEAARVAVKSVLTNNHPAFRLIVVDQSTNDDTELSLADFVAAGRIDYVRTTTVGLSRARNIGLRHAHTRVVAFTDDDCETPDDWLQAIQTIFDEQPETIVAFCSVRPGPYDASAGFVPGYECRGTRTVRTVRDKCTARAIGAGMAVRRKEMLALGGFDEELGAGGTFPSCEDWDAAVRALLAGYKVCETDRTHVLHHGFRTWKEGRSLTARDWVGIGAAYAKPLRAGRWEAASIAAYELVVCAMWPPVNDALHARRPIGIGRVVGFIRGFARGMVAPFDRRNVMFAPRGPSSPPS